MGNLNFLAAGYAVFWVVAFVFIFTLVNRQQNLEQELNTLEQLVQEDTELQAE